MPHLTIQSMKTMQYTPQLDRKLIRYALSWAAAIATSTAAVCGFSN